MIQMFVQNFTCHLIIFFIYNSTAKAIMEHDEMKGKFNDVSQILRDDFKVTRLDLEDFPKQNSTEANTVHFLTAGSN